KDEQSGDTDSDNNMANTDNTANTANNDNDIEHIVKPGDYLTPVSINGTLEYTRPPTRYNEALDNIKKYVIKEEKKTIVIGAEKNKFVPTELGTIVNNLLVSGFPTIMDYNFTANMEKKLDNIAIGKNAWIPVLDEFYKQFHPMVLSLLKEKPLIEDKYTRILGKDPTTNTDIVATITVRGPAVIKYIGNKPVYGSIKEPLKLETINLDQALELLKFPKDLGKYKNKDVVLRKGEYGLYIIWGKYTIGISNINQEDYDDSDDGVNKITLDLVATKIDQYLEKIKILSKSEFKSKTHQYNIRDGPHGKYISVKPLKGGKKNSKQYNVKLPINCNIETLDVKKIETIIENHWSNYKGKYGDKNKIEENNSPKSNSPTSNKPKSNSPTPNKPKSNSPTPNKPKSNSPKINKTKTNKTTKTKAKINKTNINKTTVTRVTKLNK
ncbi:MAG: DNA topoisomerase IA, partial [Homavirus sp.]